MSMGASHLQPNNTNKSRGETMRDFRLPEPCDYRSDGSDRIGSMI